MSRPYYIELVPVDRGWILETMAQAILKEAEKNPAQFKVKITNEPTDEADLTFFLPESAYRPLKNSIAVTYLAHKEEHRGAAVLFDKVARNSDVCITSSTKYQRILESVGAKKVYKIHLGVDTNLFTPKLRLGVVGRTYHTGRKGEQLLAEVANMSMVDLCFTGEGWPFPADYYSTADLVDFYRDIDYLLIPSLIEGGPVPMLEALSSGCPVIAPSDIGLVEDFPHIPFRRGDSKDLRRVVNNLLQNKLLLRTSVLDKDWSNFAARHLEVFSEIIESQRLLGKTSELLTTHPENERVRILLVTHGTEDASKGGPSTRVRLIAKQLREQGHSADIRHNITASDNLGAYDIVHVFNSWPPQTAQQAMTAAKNAGKKVIFSPIVLDLWHWPIYRQVMELVFETGDTSIVESVVKQLNQIVQRKQYAGHDGDVPIEGIPGHFDSLRKLCVLADYVIYLSDIERDLLKAIGAKINHGVLIHNGVDSRFSAEVDPDLFKKTHGLERYVVCVGRIEYRKNQAMLAMAMRDIPVPLVLIGAIGDCGYLEHVRAVGGTNIYHFSRIDDMDMLASAYAGASAFVLPSWCEGAPLAALEAGMTGVPLVLSNTSSEQDYFGEFAEYVSPVDVDKMRDKISSILGLDETNNQRNARQLYIRENYSDAEHVKNTLNLYKHANADTLNDESNRELILDVSAVLHTLRTRANLTGVPLAESNIIAEIMELEPKARCIVYNDINNCFVEIPYSELTAFDEQAFNQRFWFTEYAQQKGVDRRLEVVLQGVVESPNLNQSEKKFVSIRYRLALHFAQMLMRVGFKRGTLSRIAHFSKKLRRKLQTKKSAIDAVADNTKSYSKADYSNIASYLRFKDIPQRLMDFPPGSRILTLGQDWLSNEPLLDSLIELSIGHKLEAYVYDISYISGAHFSGWSDNTDRERRLEKLLRHCRTVFTESRTTAGEIAKYGQTRGMDYKVIQTQLRGKEFSVKQHTELLNFDRPYILYVSSFNRRKNHDFIICVWKDLMRSDCVMSQLGVKLVFVGEVQSEGKYRDTDYLKSLKDINIEVISNASDEHLNNLYSQCLFTIYPSMQEGWGIPVQESLMHGKVCIVSKHVPSAEEISNAALIKLSPNDFFGWREAIFTWVSNKEMRSAFEVQAKQYTPPTWREIAESILHG